MKLSEKTIKILKNFSDINQGVVIRKPIDGATQTILHTIDTQETIYGRCSVDDIFPTNVSLHAVKTLLDVISDMEDYDIEFFDTHLIVKTANSKVKIVYTDPACVFHPPKAIEKRKGDFSFDLMMNDFSALIRGAATLGLTHIRIFTEDGELFVQAEKKDHPNTDAYKLKVGTASVDCDVYITRDAVKVVPGNYKVTVVVPSDTKKGLLLLENLQDDQLFYYIGIIQE